MSAPAIVVCGSLTLDNVVRANGQILPQSTGGNAVYAALGARVWSDSVGIVSRRGDGYPEAAIERLRGHGIDTGGVRQVEGPHLMNVAFAYRDDGGRTRQIPRALLDRMDERDRARFYDISTRPGGDILLRDFAPDSDDIPSDWLEGARAIHCPSIPLAQMIDIARAGRARASPRRLWISVDSPWHDNRAAHGKDAGALLPDLDVLLPSEQDFENYRPGTPHDETARGLLAQGLEALVLKRGQDGCRIYLPGAAPFDAPVFPVDAVDPTGAGDSFCGGLAAGLVLTGDLRQAVHFGAVAASFCVERPDTQGLVAATPQEARRRLAAVSRLSGVAIASI